MLYRSIESEVPEGYYTIPFGKAAVLNVGNKATIITYGYGVHWALEAIKNPKYADVEVIDLRTLSPLDYETIFASVQKTGRALILHEDSVTGGIGGELSARITENCFTYLDAPILRCASMDTPIPFNAELEKNFMANSRLFETLDELLNF
jgi:2-oxoisovalerate dehydrogenase E1 component